MKTSMGAKTILYPTPVLVVGTYDAQGKPNAMTVAWGGICCSKPPCVAISVRKATYTYGNLVERGAFTVNIPSEDHLVQADYLGMASGRDVDKFAVTGLTPVRSTLVDAPFVLEFPLVLECTVVRVEELGLHTLFVGEILDVKAEDSCLSDEGKLSIEKVRPFIWAPGENAYCAIGRKLGLGFSAGKALGDSR
ncbi:MAG TPA: flavin reductase family protein [Thermoleophilia bacterium]|nr:flavin reductase family protein [Thermoleophilia bacterium]